MTAISSTSYSDQAVKAATFATRVVVAMGVPAYIFFKLDSIPTLQSSPGKLIAASVVILSTPSTLYCAFGAMEGFIRSCGHYFHYMTQENSDFHWDKFSKEMTTIHGLVRGTLSPITGYAIMHREWNKLGLNQDEGLPRVLKEEYYVYSIPRALGQAVVDTGKWSLGKLKLGYNFTAEKATWAVGKLWNGICWMTNQTISFVQWGWQVSQPLRKLLQDTTVAVFSWSIDRIVDLWNITLPIRRLVKWVVWDVILYQMVWNLVIKTVIWKFLIVTVIADWIVTKFIWNFLIETLLGKMVWPPSKFIGQRIIWPILTGIFTVIGTVISIAFTVISWATRQAFRNGK